MAGYVRDPEIASGTSFPISKDTLCELFEPDNIKDNISMKKLGDIGGTKKIMQCLKTSDTMGIDGKNTSEINERIDAFDRNEAIVKEARGVWELIVECFDDEMLRIISVAAIVSIIVGMIKDGPKIGWVDGSTIVIAVVIIVAVTAGNNYMKEKQFEKLNKKIDDREVEVIRNGNITRISIYQLLVGDIVYLNIGDLLPVDGILVEGNEIYIDESSVTGESDLISKNVYEKCGHKQTSFLISGSKVMDGRGKYLVATVGVNTQYGKLKLRLQEESPLTPLQIKLDSVTQQIGKVGMIVAALTTLVLLAHLGYKMAFHKHCVFCLDTLQVVIKAFIFAISIIVAAVPEGLPLAVTIALAYSVNRMKNENNLVKTLASCEIMGGANNICSDKTGTLTQNKMTATQMYFEERNHVVASTSKGSFDQGNLKILCDSFHFFSNFQNLQQYICKSNKKSRWNL